jgi:type I restriction enzyme M protein
MISEAEAILKTNEILVSDKTNLNIFWIKDRSLADLDNLPSPDELATDIMKSLQSTLESFQQLTAKLGK